MKKNLLSIGQLDEEGYKVTFGFRNWVITKEAKEVARGNKVGTLYMASNTKDCIDLASVKGDTGLWHNRLDHMSEKGMQVLCSKGRLPSLKTVDVGFCEDCVFGKQSRNNFSRKGRALREQKLELVHTDLWGPSPVTSLGGAAYYMTFIDDSTRKVWVYFLKHKDEVFDAFMKWKALVEMETGLKVKNLRSDNGGEYELGLLMEYCATNGIHMVKTLMGTPQHNGVTERMNRTLNERARSMRLKCGLPKMFLADAVNTTAFLINRGPSVPLGNGIPEEAWSGKQVNLSFLHIFGCVSYVHINSAERTKLDAKSLKCTFIRYGGDNFGYRFWDEKNRKVIRSRDVIFNKKVLYKDRNSVSNGVSSEPEIVELEDVTSSGGSREVHVDHDQVVNKNEPFTLGPVPLRRSTRDCRSPDRYSPLNFYLFLTYSGEPESYAEANRSEHRDKWQAAMDDEMDSLKANDTWELVKLPEGKQALHIGL